MYLKCHTRIKDGKSHHYWNVVEHVGGASGRRFERQVLYLGELGTAEKYAWEDRIEEQGGIVEYGAYTLEGERIFIPEEQAQPIVNAVFRRAAQRQKRA